MKRFDFSCAGFSSIPLLLALLVFSVLTGCSSDDPVSPNGSSSVTFSTEENLENIEPPDTDAEEAGTLSLRGTEYMCEEGELAEYDYEYDQRYVILNGFLYLWSDLHCTAAKYAGTSTTIKGTWTSEDLSVRIPSAYRPYACSDQSPEESFWEYAFDPKVTLTISNTTVKSKVSGELCMAPYVAAGFENGEDVEVVSSECSTVKLKNTEVNRTATITASYKTDSLVQVISYNGHTCRYSTSFQLSDAPPICTEEDPDFSPFIDFQDCLEDSKFAEDFIDSYDPDAFEKRASGLPRGFVRNLKRSLELKRH